MLVDTLRQTNQAFDYDNGYTEVLDFDRVSHIFLLKIFNCYLGNNCLVIELEYRFI